MDYIQIKGRFNNATVFTDTLEDGAYRQILELCNQPFGQNSIIRIMPDVNAGIRLGNALRYPALNQKS